MKRTIILLAGICFALSGMAQTDSTKKESDTIRVGNILIIKNKRDGKNHDGKDNDDEVNVQRRRSHKPSNVSTNWGIVDLGISQFNDKTNYTQSIAQGYLGAGANEDWFDLRNGKSINVNIWFFMQRLSMIKNIVNLKYGLGLELNNYRYSENIKYQKNGMPLVIMDNVNYSKNKLATDYLTVPMMLNFNFTPNRQHGFGFSVGASAGYLYSSRQKTISTDFGKKKDKEDFELRKWKLSYIAELALGPVKLYGSYATKSMFEKGLDHTPYNVGIRLSN
ncbi:MAG: outer membrane beta-barrel protein [Chitinophagaceae bacterium]|nr:outer membrane beta-barrel protein [Chitinophagaceae bacterium]